MYRRSYVPSNCPVRLTVGWTTVNAVRDRQGYRRGGRRVTDGIDGTGSDCVDAVGTDSEFRKCVRPSSLRRRVAGR